MRPQPILWLDGARGQYIPQQFARSRIDMTVEGVSYDAWRALEAGPDHEDYGEAWTEVLDCAQVIVKGQRYSVHQDKDVWLIPDGMEFDAEREEWVWPPEEPDPDDARDWKLERKAWGLENDD